MEFTGIVRIVPGLLVLKYTSGITEFDPLVIAFITKNRLPGKHFYGAEYRPVTHKRSKKVKRICKLPVSPEFIFLILYNNHCDLASSCRASGSNASPTPVKRITLSLRSNNLTPAFSSGFYLQTKGRLRYTYSFSGQFEMLFFGQNYKKVKRLKSIGGLKFIYFMYD